VFHGSSVDLAGEEAKVSEAQRRINLVRMGHVKMGLVVIHGLFSDFHSYFVASDDLKFKWRIVAEDLTPVLVFSVFLRAVYSITDSK
jgi:hypothetical protein